ncbi:MAG: hypothetical protein ACI9YR_002629, partial [Bacteroidia bacterium]
CAFAEVDAVNPDVWPGVFHEPILDPRQPPT